MISIRKATLKDIPLITKLWIEFLNEHDKIILKENKILKPHIIRLKNAPSIYRKYIYKNLKSGKGAVLIAEMDGKTAGYSLIFAKDNIPIFKLRKLGYISDLYVREQFRNRKISSKLISEAGVWFKKKGLKYISLAVYPDNKFAHNIYKNKGFMNYHVEMRRKI